MDLGGATEGEIYKKKYNLRITRGKNFVILAKPHTSQKLKYTNHRIT